MKFHHIGIFVKDLESGINEISKFINIASIGEEIIDSNLSVKIKFVKDITGTNYEIVSPFGSNSPVNGVLSRGHGFLNHIAYETDNFDEQIKKFRNEGMIPLGKAKQARAFLGLRVIFFLTKLGFIIELIESGIINDWK